MPGLEMRPKFEIVYRGKMFEIVHWEGKPGVIFEAAARSPGVRLLIACDKEGQQGLLMTKEMRREANGVDFRLPGGKVFDSLDALDTFRTEGTDLAKKAEEAAYQEGKEEAGVSGGTMSFLGIAKAGASVEWDLYYFLLDGAVFGHQELEDQEQGDIETVWLSYKDIFNKLIAGEIQEGRSADMLWRWLAKNGKLELINKKRS